MTAAWICRRWTVRTGGTADEAGRLYDPVRDLPWVKGNKEPDIDLNFAGEYQPVAHRYVGTIFGEKNVFKAGTVGTVAEKTAYGYVAKFFEERDIPDSTNMKRSVWQQHCTGVKRTTGQHPGGIVICPDDHEIYEFCPVQHPANDTTTDIITTHFDYHKIEKTC